MGTASLHHSRPRGVRRGASRESKGTRRRWAGGSVCVAASGRSTELGLGSERTGPELGPVAEAPRLILQVVKTPRV